MRRFAKPLYGLTPVPRVRIPPSPPFLLIPLSREACRLLRHCPLVAPELALVAHWLHTTASRAHPRSERRNRGLARNRLAGWRTAESPRSPEFLGSLSRPRQTNAKRPPERRQKFHIKTMHSSTANGSCSLISVSCPITLCWRQVSATWISSSE